MNAASAGFTIEGVLLLMGLQARTGELVLESGNNIGSILFHEGRILQAFSPYTRAIGDLLVEGGVLSDAELIEVLRLQKRVPQQPVGSLLMRAGKVSFEVVEMMVHQQIREALDVFRKWDGISFSFVAREVTPFDKIHLPVHEFIDDATIQAALDAASRMLSLKSGLHPLA